MFIQALGDVFGFIGGAVILGLWVWIFLTFVELLTFSMGKGWYKAREKFKKETINTNWNISPSVFEAIAKSFKKK